MVCTNSSPHLCPTQFHIVAHMAAVCLSPWAITLWPECPWPGFCIPVWASLLISSGRYNQLDLFVTLVANHGGEATTTAALMVGRIRYRHGDLINMYLTDGAPADEEGFYFGCEDDDNDISMTSEFANDACAYVPLHFSPSEKSSRSPSFEGYTSAYVISMTSESLPSESSSRSPSTPEMAPVAPVTEEEMDDLKKALMDDEGP